VSVITGRNNCWAISAGTNANAPGNGSGKEITPMDTLAFRLGDILAGAGPGFPDQARRVAGPRPAP